MATPVNFWKFKSPSDGQINSNNLPEIVPNTGGGAIKADPGGRRVSNKVLPKDAITSGRCMTMNIDVVSDFYWTNHGTHARLNVPKIRLVEKKLMVSAYVSNMLLSIKNVSETANEGIQQIDTALLRDDDTTNDGGLQKLLKGIRSKMKDNHLNYEFDAELLNSEYLNSYNGIYLVKPTGFAYTFPLEIGEGVGITNSFRDTGGSGGSSTPEKSDQKDSFTDKAAKLDGAIQNIADKMAKTKNLFQPGTYFEKAREFDMDAKTDVQKWKVSFPLSNSGAYDSMLQNINFVYMFMYQNTPGRRTRSIIDPPCLYEVFVEGISYVPYAYISNLNVEFLGKVSDELVDIGGKQVLMPVPEAYNITFTVTAMNPKTRNMLMAGLDSTTFAMKAGNARLTDFLFDVNKK